MVEFGKSNSRAPWLAVAAGGLLLWSAGGMAAVSAEYWDGLSGNRVRDLTSHAAFPDKPTSRATLQDFEVPRDRAGRYGSRVRGYVVVPKTGRYRFWVAADDQAELYLSSDDREGRKRLIASVPSWTDHRQFTKFDSQRSAWIQLEAGKRYYIETLHKDGSGADHLSVAWRSDDFGRRVLTGEFLQPFGVAQPEPSVPQVPSVPDVSIVDSLDRDGDGLPDAWELEHGLDPNDPADAAGDSDADGYSNLEEMQLGSHPSRPDSAPNNVTLSWTAPTTRTDGSSLSMFDIAGYRLHYGTQPGRYDQSVAVSDAYSTQRQLVGLNRRTTYYFVVTAVDRDGRESSYSNEATRAIP